MTDDLTALRDDLAIRATQINELGSVRWDARLRATDGYESEIASQALDHLHRVVTVDCPDVVPLREGASFTCVERDVQARRKQLRADRRPEAEMSALFREEQAHVDALFADAKYRDAVGAFERPRVICYCGGGISATMDALALTRLGHPAISVYDGSMTEWSRDPAMPSMILAPMAQRDRRGQAGPCA